MPLQPSGGSGESSSEAGSGSEIDCGTELLPEGYVPPVEGLNLKSPLSNGLSTSDFSELDVQKAKKALLAQPPDLRVRMKEYRKVLLLSNCPTWVSDDYSNVCTLCGDPFTVINRKHHCRRCGGLFCGACTSFKLPQIQSQKTERCCAMCLTEAFAGAEMREHQQPKQAGHASLTEAHPKMFIGERKGAAGTSSASDDEAAKAERLRVSTIKEMVQTEADYVEDLKILEGVFLLPLRLTRVLPEEDVLKIFSNAEMLCPIHTDLLKRMREKPPEQVHMGEIFLFFCQYLKTYKNYCSHHEASLDFLESLKTNQEFTKALAICMSDKRGKGQNLQSYLVKPVQRICKYPLFFRELLKHTPKDHPDYKNLQETFEEIDKVVKYINESKKVAESKRKIKEIATLSTKWELDVKSQTYNSEFQFIGSIHGKKKQSNYKIFVLSDSFVVAKVGKKEDLKFVAEYPAQDTNYVNIDDTIGFSNAFEFKRKSPMANAPNITYMCRTLIEKKTFSQLVREIINESKKKKLMKDRAESGWKSLQAVEAAKVSSDENRLACLKFPEVDDDKKMAQLFELVESLPSTKEAVGTSERKFIFDGVIKGVNLSSIAKINADYRIAVFTDICFVIGTDENCKLVLSGTFPIGNIKLVSISDTNELKNAIELIRIPENDQHFMFLCPDELTKNDLMKKLRHLINEFKRNQIKKLSAKEGKPENAEEMIKALDTQFKKYTAAESTKVLADLLEQVDGIWEEGLITPSRVLDFGVNLYGVNLTDRFPPVSNNFGVEAPGVSLEAFKELPKELYTIYGMDDVIIIVRSEKQEDDSSVILSNAGLFSAKETRAIKTDLYNGFELRREIPAQGGKNPPYFGFFCKNEEEKTKIFESIKAIVDKCIF